MRAFVGALRAALVGALLVGCADAEPSSPPPESPPGEGVFGRAPAPVGGVPSVIMLTSQAAIDTDDAREPTMDQLGLTFLPRLLIARPGEPVHFANSETLPHNVNVRSIAGDSMVLNTDTPPGERFDFVFEEEGGYDVLCEVHPGMTAFIFVTAAPHAVFAETDGSFHLSGVAAGEYTLTVWSIDPAARSTHTIVARAAEGTEVTFVPFG